MTFCSSKSTGLTCTAVLMAVRKSPPSSPPQVAGFHLESVEFDLSDVKCFALEAARVGRADGSVESSQINSDLQRLTI